MAVNNRPPGRQFPDGKNTDNHPAIDSVSGQQQQQQQQQHTINSTGRIMLRRMPYTLAYNLQLQTGHQPL